MIDIDLNNLKILPADHVSLKHFDYSVAVEKKNKTLSKAIISIIAIGIIILIYNIIKDESNKQKN